MEPSQTPGTSSQLSFPYLLSIYRSCWDPSSLPEGVQGVGRKGPEGEGRGVRGVVSHSTFY